MYVHFNFFVLSLSCLGFVASSAQLDMDFDKSGNDKGLEASTISYPLLSCLNKDPLLSHAAKFELTKADGSAYKIGRSGVEQVRQGA